MNKLTAFSCVVARILSVGLFFTSGVEKIVQYSENVSTMAQNGVPAFFLPLVILLEVGGSIAIACGFLTRFTSVFMAAFSIIAGFLFYQGFTLPHLIVWLKNASCAAGFILLVINGPGRWSLDHWISTRFGGNKIKRMQNSAA
ncbi:DoxX family protein [Rouxiella silvae]|jgi:putative oxidoreductase|uniref:DoxX family protein n=1 Tax=Rouxiella silvae TaxID=1646373 RepID=A0AA40X742_9GAMM|nr:DoxX family protein [Rouxiella silvae]KQN50534.1 DoxX family protein [Serratia sp. Leaf50]MBF6639604.1 DoxX family protein [Rouxiella silvae]ORJ22749.1 DoxX family protein [Rouxiella silvae]